MLWFALLVTATPDVWTPIPRPVVAAHVEAALSPGARMSRAHVVDLLIDAMNESTGGRGVSLPASVVTVCGGDLQCRLDLARSTGSAILVHLYVSGTEAQLRFDLVVRSSTLPATSPPVAEVPQPWLVRTASVGPSDARVRAWLAAALSPIERRTAYSRPVVVELRDVPPGSVVGVGEASTTTDGNSLWVARPVDAELRLSVAAPDYEVLDVLLGRTELVHQMPRDSLVPSPRRRIRQATFWSGVAMSAAGAALVLAAASRSPSGCVRTFAAPEDSCLAPLPLGSDHDSQDHLLPVAAGLTATGLALASGPVWRDDHELESDTWVALASALVGAATIVLTYAAGTQ